MFRNVTFPTSSVPTNLSFYWKSNGEDATQDYDYLRVYLTETTVTPLAGTQLTSTNSVTLGTYKWNNNIWQEINISIPASNNGSTKRLVFSWVNDSSVGTQPPAAIDNIILTGETSTPITYTVTYNINNGTGTTPSAQTVNAGSSISLANGSSLSRNGFIFNGWNTNFSGTGTNYNAGSSFTPTDNITFYAKWDNNSTVFSEDFEGTNSFTIINGTQTNQWHIGTATVASGGGARSAYISNNNGTSNAYTPTTASTVHMYRDVTFPASSNAYTLSFNWRAQGDTVHQLKVFLIDTTATLTAGTQPSGTALQSFSGQSTWQTATISIPASNSGTTKRLVFTWHNDSYNVSGLPAAIDNIILTR